MAFFGGRWRATLMFVVLGLLASSAVRANPALVVDVDTGNVLSDTMGTQPWYPASLTKLMTTYVALSAVREGRITLSTPLMVSARAASQAPSKMGFRPGTLVTLDNALKMLMVKSPNDIAVTIAEGIGGSVEGFADQMNDYGARLGLHESHFDNPNGLPDPNHYSSARDLATIARALIREFPEQHDLFDIGDMEFQGQIIHNHNNLLGRYPGVDGMKTGYTCSAGFNVVLSAQRNGRRLIVVVLGSPSVAMRSLRAAALFDKYFVDEGAGEGPLASLPASASSQVPDLRSTVCGRGRANAISEAEAEIDPPASASAPSSPLPFFPSRNGTVEPAGTAPATTGPNVLQMPRTAFVPVRVFIGPVDGYTGPIARARDARPDAIETATAPTPGSRSAAARPDTASESPAPLALVGAAPALPASLAANRLGKRGRPLSLAVRSARRRSKIHDIDPKLAAGITPSILAAKADAPSKTETPTKVAKPDKAKPKGKGAVASAKASGTKLKAKAKTAASAAATTK